MKLRSKFLKWNAGLPVAMLNKETAIELGVKAQEMILIKTLSKHPKEMTAVLDIIDGEFITEEQELTSEKAAVLGKDAAETFFGKDSSPVGETIRINNRTFRVTGILSS